MQARYTIPRRAYVEARIVRLAVPGSRSGPLDFLTERLNLKNRRSYNKQTHLSNGSQVNLRHAQSLTAEH